jgi:hypothetical protein
MDQYLISTTARLHREDMLREAQQAHLAKSVREPHAWRHRLGKSLMRVGRFLADEPADKAARPRARIA